MKEIKCLQGSDEWKVIRTARITGSNFDTIMSTPKQRILPFNDTQLDYLYSVCAEIMTNIPEDDFITYDMQRGIDMEPLAKMAYEKSRFVTIRDCGIFVDDFMCASSPDGIIGDNESIIEVKCPKAKTHVKYMLDPVSLYNKYHWQCVAECYFTGIPAGVIISYHPDFEYSKQIVEYHFEPTVEEYEQLTARLKECENIIKLWMSDPIDIVL